MESGLASDSEILEALGNTADACFAVDAQQVIREWNQGAERLFGYSRADVIGRPCAAIVGGLRKSGRRLCTGDCPVMRRARGGSLIHDYDLFCRDRAGRHLALNVGIVVLGMRDEITVVHYGRRIRATAEGRAPLSVADEREREERWRGLTPREEEILGLLANGMGTGEVARALDISPATVRNHVQSLMGKLGVHGRLAAVAAWTRHQGWRTRS